MRRAALAALALTAPFALGCGHMDTRQAMFRPPLPPTGHPAEVYLVDTPLPARPFSEIAIVQAIGFGSKARPEDVVDALTERASRLGCDAVLRTFIDQGYSRAHASGVCVKWLAPGPAAPRPVLPAAPPRNPARPWTPPSPSPTMEPLPSTGPGGGGFR